MERAVQIVLFATGLVAFVLAVVLLRIDAGFGIVCSAVLALVFAILMILAIIGIISDILH